METGKMLIGKPKNVDWDVETRYRIALSFNNYGDKTKLTWSAYHCAEWTIWVCQMLLSTQKIAWLLWISKIDDGLVLKSSQQFTEVGIT